MSYENRNYHHQMVVEGESFYYSVSRLDADLFNKFMNENVKLLGEIRSFDEVRPSSELLKELKSKGYEHEYYQCHYSAKAATILSEDLKYYTGFVLRGGGYGDLITHSFNMKGNDIVDLARISNREVAETKNTSCFPHLYYGIEIPREFVLKFKDATFGVKYDEDNHHMMPLLSEWFCFQNPV